MYSYYSPENKYHLDSNVWSAVSLNFHIAKCIRYSNAHVSPALINGQLEYIQHYISNGVMQLKYMMEYNQHSTQDYHILCIEWILLVTNPDLAKQLLESQCLNNNCCYSDSCGCQPWQTLSWCCKPSYYAMLGMLRMVCSQWILSPMQHDCIIY